VSSDQAAVDAAQGQLAAAQQKQTTDSHQNQARLAADQLNLSRAQTTATDAQNEETLYDQSSKYTALPAVGQSINPGHPVWSIDGHPAALLAGTLSPWRAFIPGMPPGPDVAALNQALLALGDAPGTSSDQFTSGTAAAIDRLQASLGVPQTGTLPLGAAVFSPGALRVTAVHPQLDGPVSAGAPVLDVTATTPIVNVALPVDQSYLVKVGDPVSVRLPDGTSTDGTISGVGTVAANTTPSSGSGSNSPSATINVTVSLAHATGAAALDQAPLTVNITNATASDALAVPTTALLSLAGGGYAVEVVAPDGTHQLVPVTTGIFDDQDGLVQVTGAGLSAGQRIVAAA
jgi:multidrug efflux pump subunit AcrA (membrane-fusion protein)